MERTSPEPYWTCGLHFLSFDKELTQFFKTVRSQLRPNFHWHTQVNVQAPYILLNNPWLQNVPETKEKESHRNQNLTFFKSKMLDISWKKKNGHGRSKIRSMDQCNTVKSAYAKNRHLGQYYTHLKRWYIHVNGFLRWVSFLQNIRLVHVKNDYRLQIKCGSMNGIGQCMGKSC